VIGLAKKRGIQVIERAIMPDELEGFSECFITGSAAEVTPVGEIGQWRFQPGALTQALSADYSAAVLPKAAVAAE
jgi:branched-chain amino acid aminotransferase